MVPLLGLNSYLGFLCKESDVEGQEDGVAAGRSLWGEAACRLVPTEPWQKTTYFSRETTYSNRKFDILDPNK